MAGLQFGIGATNDILDADADRLAQPWKPIPSGRISPRSARIAAAGAMGAGLLLSLLLGLPEFVVAAAGLAVGATYNLGLKRTAFAWVPYAVGLPLLVVFAWLAAVSTLPPALPSLVALGLLCGLAVGLANGLVDFDTDLATGRGGLVPRLGRRGALALLAAAEGTLVIVVLVMSGAGSAQGAGTLARVLAGVAAGLLASGWLLSSRRRHGARELGWEAQAVGIALLGISWLAAVSGAGA